VLAAARAPGLPSTVPANINSEDKLVQKTFADYLHQHHGWHSIYAFDAETFGPDGTLGRTTEREVVLVRELRAAIIRLNPSLPPGAVEDAIRQLTTYDFSRSAIQHNHDFYRLVRDGVPVQYRDAQGTLRNAQVRVIDFRNGSTNGEPNNRFLAVRELKIQALAVPHYNRRADLVCFVNGLPLVFIELKKVSKNLRHAFDGNLRDYRDTIPHAFYHNAFLIVSNGDKAKYGSITAGWDHFAEWKRNDERDQASLDARVLLDGMLSQKGLLDLVENFILFDASKPGGTRKIVAKNHQYLGVNRAVAATERQEALKLQFPPAQRLTYRVLEIPARPYLARRLQDSPQPADEKAAKDEGLVTEIANCSLDDSKLAVSAPNAAGPLGFNDQPGPLLPILEPTKLPLIERAHQDLGRLGVFWHTQGSGKSYSMIFYAEKVRRTLHGNFTFLVMTDREDLDDQIFKTFVGCGVADEKTPRPGSGKSLKAALENDSRFIFSLVHKFNQPVSAREPYSKRDDIIVLSDEAHRTQGGKLARNMRLALPNAAFLGFTGTPILRGDRQTRSIFGSYVSRYDFRRSQQDQSTVRLIYENRGEKLGLTLASLNDTIADRIEQADLDDEQRDKLQKLLGKDYEVVTADRRLEQIADDFVVHCANRWETGKFMLVCLDKITCGRMHQLILPRWQARTETVRATVLQLEIALAGTGASEQADTSRRLSQARAHLAWMESTLIQFVISGAQGEVADFNEWGIDIRPHRQLMKVGFETPNGHRVPLDDAFKDPSHPFRVAIVCAMWLTGFDVECLSTLYIDKPMKAHTLMQAIARANRVYPGKACGVIVDYNGMLKSLNEALAQYAVGDPDDPEGEDAGEVAAPVEELVQSLLEAIDAAEALLRSVEFEPATLLGLRGFPKIEAIRDAVEALYTDEDVRARFQVVVQQVVARFRALSFETATPFAERRDNLDTILEKLGERTDNANITDVLKALHRIVNDAIGTQGRGEDQAEGMKVDISKIDFDRLRQEFAKKVRRKHTVIKDLQQIIDDRLSAMLRVNPTRMDLYKRYQEIIADYNREKDRATVEETFARLLAFVKVLDAEQQRAVAEGLTEEEQALFDLLRKETLTKAQREKVKQASQQLLASIRALLAPIPHWTHNTQTQAEVEVSLRDHLAELLPVPPYTEQETENAYHRLYDYVWSRSAAGDALAAAA
jgi:type I restriction enzyme R subunit